MIAMVATLSIQLGRIVPFSFMHAQILSGKYRCRFSSIDTRETIACL